MAIRLRTVDGVRIAICAARSVPKPGDVYLDDAEHHALSVKFDLDYSGKRLGPIYAGSKEAKLIEQEESNNPNRDWWETVYGTGLATDLATSSAPDHSKQGAK
jgi:hypothetical protein